MASKVKIFCLMVPPSVTCHRAEEPQVSAQPALVTALLRSALGLTLPSSLPSADEDSHPEAADASCRPSLIRYPPRLPGFAFARLPGLGIQTPADTLRIWARATGPVRWLSRGRSLQPKPDRLNLIPGSDMVRENPLLRVVLRPPSALWHVQMHPCTRTNKYLSKIN